MINYKVLILDLDGTVYVDGKPIKGIISKLNEFKNQGNEIFYLSNNTSVSRSFYLDKLSALGLTVKESEIVTPVSVAGLFLGEKFKKGFIIGTNSFVKELENSYGIKNEINNPEFVLIAFDKELSYEKLQKGCEHINSGTPYFITHIDLACPSEKGPIPDCGSISLLMENVTNVKPKENFGKPSLRMRNYIEDIIKNYSKSDVLMVGDRLYTDIALGNILGVQTLLVLSGESKQIDYEINKTFIVNHCSDTLSDFMDGNELKKI